jgi:hypothetical protein
MRLFHEKLIRRAGTNNNPMPICSPNNSDDIDNGDNIDNRDNIDDDAVP